MLQLSGVLEMQSLRLKRDALKMMNATVSGTPAENLWSVLENYFGIEEDIKERELDEAQSLGEMLRSLREEDDEDVPAMRKDQADEEDEAMAREVEMIEGDEDDVESIASSQASSNVGIGAKRKTLSQLKKKAAEEFPAKCALKDTRVFYPTSAESMHSTGVDSSLMLQRKTIGKYKGYYECNFGDCKYVGHTNAVCASHVRRCHLGFSLGCRFCQEKKWYQGRGWSDHMDKYHSDQSKFEVIEMPAGVIKAEEIDPELFISKEKFIIPSPGEHPAVKIPEVETKRPRIDEKFMETVEPLIQSSQVSGGAGFVSADLEKAMESQDSQEEI